VEDNPFVRSQEPIVLTDIQAVEQRYGFVLPDDYKALILTYNGGRPLRRTFIQIDAEGQPIERKLRSFYAIKNGPDPLENVLKSLRSQLHPDLVPFGEESGGDQFVLSVGSQDYGSVYYVAHEFYTPPEYDYDEQSDKATPPAPLDYGSGVYFLAPSFTSFLDGLVAGTPA
jgi:hypothetical protein